jgi:hypothetical protein
VAFVRCRDEDDEEADDADGAGTEFRAELGRLLGAVALGRN